MKREKGRVKVNMRGGKDREEYGRRNTRELNVEGKSKKRNGVGKQSEEIYRQRDGHKDRQEGMLKVP